MLLDESITDSRAQAFFQRYLRNNIFTDEEQALLRGFRLCGSKVISQTGALPAVFVVNRTTDDGETASHFYGIARCHSAWACPYCTARVMAEKSKEIAAAIDVLATEHNQSAMMITLTFPHLWKMSCAESFTILKKAWRMFIKPANKGRHKINHYITVKGEKKSYVCGDNIYGKFRSELRIIHHIRAYEFTWGQNGWHPHIHALFWAPNETFDKATDYEAELNARWLHCVEIQAKKYWGDQNPSALADELNARADELFRSGNRDKHPGLTISKDLNGKARRITSSAYISGWSGNTELTRTDLKKASAGHYTIHQIIDNAVKAETREESDKWLKLFTEYALATKGSRRVEKSNSGLTALAQDWLKRNPNVNYLKKKDTSKAQKTQVVCWFNENQWWLICNYIRIEVFDIHAQILEKARLPDGKTEIENLLLKYGVDIRENGEHHLTKFIEQKVLAA
ncbi:MAG: hypothetical protein IJP68_09915 [Selenomonadaceae bacterium]|nr:hypothetical protein [Selenomonadaceae bacterium]